MIKEKISPGFITTCLDHPALFKNFLSSFKDEEILKFKNLLNNWRNGWGDYVRDWRDGWGNHENN